MRRVALALLLLIAPATTLTAQTLTTRDVIELTKAGLGEEALLALIEVHRSIFPIDRDTLKMLKDAGVRDNVIVAMIRSGRDPVAVPAPLAPFPTPSVIVDRGDGTQPMIISDREPVETRVVVVERGERDEASREEHPRVVEREVPVAVPVYVPLPTGRQIDDRPDPPKKAEPVYWGFGGKLRPDAWKPSEPESKKASEPESKKPSEPEKKKPIAPEKKNI